MLINTLFLSKPLTLSEHSEGSQTSDKLFGFLFSEIMNVSNESKKQSLITDHIGGNLIDYKSVFINYNFESTVNLSNPQLEDSKDPIISLSGLFLISEILNDKKINDVEKIIYSPQQFVSSFKQLINSLFENSDYPSDVEIKLFSKNFIFSQKIDNTQTKNIEKFLFETIENEPSFSLTLSAFGKQVLFEVFSQVVPSLLTGEAADNKKVNNSELENIIQGNKPSIQRSSNENQLLDSSILNKVDSSGKELKTEAVLTDSNLVENILTKEQSNSGKLFENAAINTSPKNDTVKQDNSESVTNSTIYQATDKENLSDYGPNKNLSIETNPTKTKDSISVEKSFTSLSKINEVVQESALEVLKNLQNDQSNSVNQGKNNPTETNKSSENSQIKIIIQGDNQNSVQSTKNINSELDYNLSKILEDNKSQNQQDVIVKIITNSESQQKSSYNVVSDKFFQDHLIADRQIQNLFRSISSGKVNLTGELNIESIQSLEPESFQNYTGNTQINNETNSFENIGTKDTIKNIPENPAKAAVKDISLNIDIKAIKETFNSALVQNDYQSTSKLKLDKPAQVVVPDKNSNFVSETETHNSSSSNNTQLSQGDKNLVSRNNETQNIGKLNSDGKLLTKEETNNSNNQLDVLEQHSDTTSKSIAKQTSYIDIKNPEFSNTKIKLNQGVEVSLNKIQGSLESQKSVQSATKLVREATVNNQVTEFEEAAEIFNNRQNTNQVFVKEAKKDLAKELTVNYNIEDEASTIVKDNSFQNEKNPSLSNSQNINQISNSKTKFDSFTEIRTNLRSNDTATSATKGEYNQEKNIPSPFDQNTNQIFVKKAKINSTPGTISSSNHNDKTNKLIEGDNIQEETNTSLNNGLNTSQISFRKVKINSNENSVPSTKHNEITNEKVENKDLQSADGLNKQDNVNFRIEFNYRKDKKDNPDHQGSLRVFNEKPAKGVLGINSETFKDEKVSFDSPKVTTEVQKDLKDDYKEQSKPELEINKNEKNAYSNNSQQDNSKNSHQEVRNTISNEKQLSGIDESYSAEFRKTLSGFEKEANPLTSKNVNHNSTISNKFDFNKYFESKSFENFVRTLSDNNLNYRAELTNSVKINNTIELRLYPEELGRVKIVIENSESAVSARIEVQSEQAKNIVMSNLPQLREALKQEGLNAHNLNVYLGSEEQNGQNSTNQKRKNSNSKMMFDDQKKNDEAKIKNLGYNTIEYLA